MIALRRTADAHRGQRQIVHLWARLPTQQGQFPSTNGTEWDRRAMCWRRIAWGAIVLGRRCRVPCR
jgi:hypothetical protein